MRDGHVPYLSSLAVQAASTEHYIELCVSCVVSSGQVQLAVMLGSKQSGGVLSTVHATSSRVLQEVSE